LQRVVCTSASAFTDDPCLTKKAQWKGVMFVTVATVKQIAPAISGVKAT
jgi:hypothetical protein